MLRSFHVTLLALFLFYSAEGMNKNSLIKQCFYAIETNNINDVIELINGGVDCNSQLNLNQDYLTEKDFYTFEGESECTLLEWARYKNRAAIYIFLSRKKDINFVTAGFLPLDAGSLLSLNEDGSWNDQGKNYYPLQYKKWPTRKSTPITDKNRHLATFEKCVKN